MDTKEDKKLKDKFKAIESMLIDIGTDVDKALVEAKAENDEIKIQRLHEILVYVCRSSGAMQRALWLLIQINERR